MEPIEITLLILLVLVIVGLIIYAIVKSKYKNFVIIHSVSLKKQKEINTKYHFISYPDLNWNHSYDNENIYEDITTRDYLTYQLTYYKSQASKALNDSLTNKSVFESYKREIKEQCKLNTYDTKELLKNKEWLETIETKLFKENLKNYQRFTINVTLYLTNINGVIKGHKVGTFEPEEIKAIINKLNQKRGDFYLNNEVWQSICKVERGKVSNKMRFSIYEKDGYRCKKCGKKTNDLEVDHIIPIAKGGKSTYNNLQTLCHRCNVNKGSNIE